MQKARASVLGAHAPSRAAVASPTAFWPAFGTAISEGVDGHTRGACAPRTSIFLHLTEWPGGSPYRAGSAFSLVELLVTIAIIAVLAALLMPTMGRAHESGRSTVCQGNLHQVGVALQMYVDDSRNIMPTMFDAPVTGPVTNPVINIVLAPQLGSTQVLQCPSDNQRIFQQTGSSYSWNSLVNGQNADHLQILNLKLGMTRIPLVLDKQSFHAPLGPSNAVNYLYADGHIKNRLIMAGPQ